MAQKTEKTNVMRVLDAKKVKYESHCYADTDALSGTEVAFVLGQNPASNAVVLQGISGQYDGKSASRLRAKPSGGLYSVFP